MSQDKTYHRLSQQWLFIHLISGSRLKQLRTSNRGQKYIVTTQKTKAL